MTLDLASFAEKLRRCREMFGETLDQLAAATGMATDDLCLLEAASRAPSGDEVLILADHFLCDFKFFISNERTTPIERTEKLFRAHGKDLSSNDRWSIQEFLFLCENEAYLIAELGRPAPVRFRFRKKGTFFKRHGVDAAAELRRALRHAPNEVPEVFFDLRRLGVHVFRRRLQNQNISGLFILHPSAGPCVLVNYEEDVYRQRFTAAHEAAHWIFDVDDEYVVSFEKWKGVDRREVRANVFAGAYLVPKGLVDQLPEVHWDEPRLLHLADQLGVNVRVLLIALEREGRLSKDEARSFERARISRRGKEDPELPASLSPKSRLRKQALLERGISAFYAELCFDAAKRGIVSMSRAAEMLLVDERELRQIANLFGVRGS
jgi:Zn-dependent peptidase ImmA (M78 family)